MSSRFQPRYSGSHKPESLGDGFIQKLAARVNKGLFSMASSRRNQYKIVEQSETYLHFCSSSLLTGINIGLNDVQIQVDQTSGEIRYDVSYWTWAKYSIFLCLALGLVLGCSLLPPLFGLYLFPKDQYPPLMIMKVAILPMVLFWGLVWPWILIAFHKGSAVKYLTRILDEVNTQTP
jgi:hypothetical protein